MSIYDIREGFNGIYRHFRRLFLSPSTARWPIGQSLPADCLHFQRKLHLRHFQAFVVAGSVQVRSFVGSTVDSLYLSAHSGFAPAVTFSVQTSHSLLHLGSCVTHDSCQKKLRQAICAYIRTPLLWQNSSMNAYTPPHACCFVLPGRNHKHLVPLVKC
jgi:hypothetical protein